MAPKKKSSGEIKGDELIGGVLADAPKADITELERIVSDVKSTDEKPAPDYVAATAAAPKVVALGYMLQNIDAKIVGRDGMWTRDPHLALRFLTEIDAEAYATLHHREEMNAVPGV